VLWLLRDFDLLSVVLRALSLSLEALSVGSVLFLLFALRGMNFRSPAHRRVCRSGAWFALGLAATQVASTAVATSVVMYNAGMRLGEVATAPFFIAHAVLCGSAILLGVLLLFWRRTAVWAVLATLVAIAASVALSHAASRLDHRALLIALTAGHHLGVELWIGAMPALVIALRASDDADAMRIVQRYSLMALTGVPLLIGTGIGLSYFYIGSWQGLYGTSYGAMVVAKVYLMLAALTLGAANYLAGRRMRAGQPTPFLQHLRRLAEAEIGLGFTAILAAASLTAQSPAADLQPQDKLTIPEIVQRMEWKTPTFHTPSVSQLVPPTKLKVGLQEALFTGGAQNDANDQAWSEYNHHWAGLIVLACGLLALVSRIPGQRWARHWPLLFVGLSVFILLRADPENWPLGPRPFWASFSEPDVLEHRLFALLIVVFALFEWAVETGHLRWPRAAYVFPLMCSLGGALLLTHQHSLGDLQQEMFVEMTHTPIALFGATAGWGRWIELRLPRSRAARIAAWVWPVCLVLVGLLLLNYREH
jgi:putative copper resistance protein D